MTTLIQRCALIASLTLLVACGGSDDGTSSGGSNDGAQSVAAVKAEVATMETAELESSRDDTQEEIASVETQIEDLLEKIKEKGAELGGGALDSIMGEGTSEQAMADAKEVKAQLESELKDLQALAKTLKAKLDVYLAELKARAAG